MTTGGIELEPQELAKLRYQIYLDQVGRLQGARQSSFEQYDKAIMTLSSGGLALSLGFAQTVLKGGNIASPCLLYFSWFFFVGAILLTVISLFIVPFAMNHEVEKCGRYYLQGDENASTEKLGLTTLTTVLNVGSGLSFILAIISTVLFVSFNLKGT